MSGNLPRINPIVMGSGYMMDRLFKRGFRAPVYKKIDMKDKVAIVTGANSGIGRVTAFELAKKGAIVILACRNLKLGEEALEDLKSKSGSEKLVGNFFIATTHKLSYHYSTG